MKTRVVRLRNHVFGAAVAALAVHAFALPSAVAQGGPPGGAMRAAGVGQGGQQPPRLTPEKRAAMERQLQARINNVIRQRLALNDDQFGKLQEVASHIEDDRRTLRNDELTTRFALRQELLAGDRVNETKVGELLDKLPKFERRRVELIEQEQRELAKFLSPSQRARYFALQDELRRNMQDMQRRRMGLDGGAPDSAGFVPPRLRGRGSRPPGTPK